MSSSPTCPTCLPNASPRCSRKCSGSRPLALDGGPDGLDHIRRLITQASAGDRLKSHGVILLEMDPEQMAESQSLAASAFPEAEITIEPDLGGRDRVLSVSLGGDRYDD